MPLGNAGDLAPGFADSQSYKVLQRHFSRKDLGTLKTQLYLRVEQTIHVEDASATATVEALELDPFATRFLTRSTPVRIESKGSTAVGHKLPIPDQCVICLPTQTQQWARHTNSRMPAPG